MDCSTVDCMDGCGSQISIAVFLIGFVVVLRYTPQIKWFYLSAIWNRIVITCFTVSCSFEYITVQYSAQRMTLHSYCHSDSNKFMELMDDFQKAMEELTTGVRSLINMYCATFHVRYTPPDLPTKSRGVYYIVMLYYVLRLFHLWCCVSLLLFNPWHFLITILL